MKRFVFVVSMLIGIGHISTAQDYASIANGSWTSTSNWNRISNWGSFSPGINNDHTSGTATVNHALTITGNYTQASSTVNIATGASVTVTGDYRKNGGGQMNVSGTLTIEGNAVLNGPFNILPGGQVIVKGSLTVISSNYLNVGTTTAAPPYADLIVYGNVLSQTSGDILVRRNGRVAIFGDVVATGGGTLFTIQNGGQVYVHGDIDFTGNGGNHITNENTADPFGFYVNGEIVNNGGGNTTTDNIGDQATMQGTNPDFFDWIADIPDSPLAVLPITLTDFRVADSSFERVTLRWTTIMESNFDKFIVERSANGLEYFPIGEVAGQGRDIDAVETRYSFIDLAPSNGWNYYRLKSVDIDLSYTYSRVVSAKIERPLEIWVTPNPASERIQLFASFSPSEGDQIVLYDRLGRPVLQRSASEARDGIDLDQGFIPGVYLLKYVSQNAEYTTRIVIR